MTETPTTQIRITNEMLEEARDELYNAIWGLVEATKNRRNSGEEQEELSRAIIEESNLSFLYGKQVERESKQWTQNYPQLLFQSLTDTKPDLSTQMKP